VEIVVFTLNAIVVYLVSDQLLGAIERRRGAALPQRQLAFFAIFLVLVLASFAVLEELFR
jgi:hypothetical protein